MYQAHFGLHRHLFEDGIAQDADVYLGAAERAAAADLTVALTLRDSIAVITGPAGIGKTTIAAHALRAMTTRLALGLIGDAPLTPHELLEMLLTEFGFSPYRNSRVERLQMWRQFLNEMRVTETRVCVLVENADEIPTEVLAALGSLTAADANGCSGANVVLTARAPVAELLASPVLAGLRQRTRLKCRMAPLESAALKEYLAHRATAAGGELTRLFSDEAIEALERYSGGIIRVLDNLCETALAVAASGREPRVEAGLVARVAVDMFGITLAPVPSSQPHAPAPSVHAQALAPSSKPRPAAAPRKDPPAPAARPTAEPGGLALGLRPVSRIDAPARATPPTSIVGRTAAATQPAAQSTTAAPETASATPIRPGPVTPPRPPANASSSRAPTSASGTQTQVFQSRGRGPEPRVLGSGLHAPTPRPEPRAPTPEAGPRAPMPDAGPRAPTPEAGPRAPMPEPEPRAPMPEPEPRAPMPEAGPRAPALPSEPRARARAPEPRPPAQAPLPPPSTAAFATLPPASTAASGDSADTAPEIPVLSFEAGAEESSDPFVVEFDMSPAEMDEVLDIDMPDVPTLIDSIEPAERVPADPSMQIALDEETQHKLANLEALAHAKALEDISNSMAETLFGDAELEQLAATLAVATGARGRNIEEDDEPLNPTKARSGS